jgi:hypothetical protein
MTVSDVTEQHLAKEALGKAFDEIKKSEDCLRLVIDTIPTLVWRAGPEGIPDFLPAHAQPISPWNVSIFRLRKWEMRF